MENSTEVVVTQLVYINQGSLMILLNFLVVAAIFKYKVLRQRKEFLIIGGLAFSDVLSGVAYLLAGSYRYVYFVECLVCLSSQFCVVLVGTIYRLWFQ